MILLEETGCSDHVAKIPSLLCSCLCHSKDNEEIDLGKMPGNPCMALGGNTMGRVIGDSVVTQNIHQDANYPNVSNSVAEREYIAPSDP